MHFSDSENLKRDPIYRYGFVRLALIAGAALVPVFAFGENELYKQVDNPKGSKLRIFQEKLKKVPILMRRFIGVI